MKLWDLGIVLWILSAYAAVWSFLIEWEFASIRDFAEKFPKNLLSATVKRLKAIKTATSFVGNSLTTSSRLRNLAAFVVILATSFLWLPFLYSKLWIPPGSNLWGGIAGVTGMLAGEFGWATIFVAFCILSALIGLVISIAMLPIFLISVTILAPLRKNIFRLLAFRIACFVMIIIGQIMQFSGLASRSIW